MSLSEDKLVILERFSDSDVQDLVAEVRQLRDRVASLEKQIERERNAVRWSHPHE